MPKAKFVPFDSVEHQERRPGVVLSSLVDGDTGATQLSSGVAEFAVGASAPMHYHDAEESVIVIEGEGLMVIDGQEHIVHPNDAAFIPRRPPQHRQPRRPALQDKLDLRQHQLVDHAGGVGAKRLPTCFRRKPESTEPPTSSKSHKLVRTRVWPYQWVPSFAGTTFRRISPTAVYSRTGPGRSG